MNTVYEDETIKEFNVNWLKEFNSSSVMFYIPTTQIEKTRREM